MLDSFDLGYSKFFCFDTWWYKIKFYKIMCVNTLHYYSANNWLIEWSTHDVREHEHCRSGVNCNLPWILFCEYKQKFALTILFLPQKHALFKIYKTNFLHCISQRCMSTRDFLYSLAQIIHRMVKKWNQEICVAIKIDKNAAFLF